MFVCTKCLEDKFHNRPSMVQYFSQCSSCLGSKRCFKIESKLEPKVKQRAIKPLSAAERFNIFVCKKKKSFR